MKSCQTHDGIGTSVNADVFHHQLLSKTVLCFVCVECMGAADHWTPTLMSVMCSVVRWSIWL